MRAHSAREFDLTSAPASDATADDDDDNDEAAARCRDAAIPPADFVASLPAEAAGNRRQCCSQRVLVKQARGEMPKK